MFSSLARLFNPESTQTPRGRRSRQVAGTTATVSDHGAVFPINRIVLDDLIVPVSPALRDIFDPNSDEMDRCYHAAPSSAGGRLFLKTFPVWSLCPAEYRRSLRDNFGFTFDAVDLTTLPLAEQHWNCFGLGRYVTATPPVAAAGGDALDVVYFATVRVESLVLVGAKSNDDPLVVFRDRSILTLLNDKTRHVVARASLYKLSRKHVAQALAVQAAKTSTAAAGNGDAFPPPFASSSFSASSSAAASGRFDWRHYAELLMKDIPLHQPHKATHLNHGSPSDAEHGVSIHGVFRWATDLMSRKQHREGNSSAGAAVSGPLHTLLARKSINKIALKDLDACPGVVVRQPDGKKKTTSSSKSDAGEAAADAGEVSVHCTLMRLDSVSDLGLATADLVSRYLLDIPYGKACRYAPTKPTSGGGGGGEGSFQWPWTAATCAARLTLTLLCPGDVALLTNEVMPMVEQFFVDRNRRRAAAESSCVSNSASRSMTNDAALQHLAAAAAETCGKAAMAEDLPSPIGPRPPQTLREYVAAHDEQAEAAAATAAQQEGGRQSADSSKLYSRLQAWVTELPPQPVPSLSSSSDHAVAVSSAVEPGDTTTTTHIADPPQQPIVSSAPADAPLSQRHANPVGAASAAAAAPPSTPQRRKSRSASKRSVHPNRGSLDGKEVTSKVEAKEVTATGKTDGDAYADDDDDAFCNQQVYFVVRGGDSAPTEPPPTDRCAHPSALPSPACRSPLAVWHHAPRDHCHPQHPNGVEDQEEEKDDACEEESEANGDACDRACWDGADGDGDGDRHRRGRDAIPDARLPASRGAAEGTQRHTECATTKTTAAAAAAAAAAYAAKASLHRMVEAAPPPNKKSRGEATHDLPRQAAPPPPAAVRGNARPQHASSAAGVHDISDRILCAAAAAALPTTMQAEVSQTGRNQRALTSGLAWEEVTATAAHRPQRSHAHAQQERLPAPKPTAEKAPPAASRKQKHKHTQQQQRREQTLHEQQQQAAAARRVAAASSFDEMFPLPPAASSLIPFTANIVCNTRRHASSANITESAVYAAAAPLPHLREVAAARLGAATAPPPPPPPPPPPATSSHNSSNSSKPHRNVPLSMGTAPHRAVHPAPAPPASLNVDAADSLRVSRRLPATAPPLHQEKKAEEDAKTMQRRGTAVLSIAPQAASLLNTTQPHAAGAFGGRPAVPPDTPLFPLGAKRQRPSEPKDQAVQSVGRRRTETGGAFRRFMVSDDDDDCDSDKPLMARPATDKAARSTKAPERTCHTAGGGAVATHMPLASPGLPPCDALAFSPLAACIPQPREATAFTSATVTVRPAYAAAAATVEDVTVLARRLADHIASTPHLRWPQAVHQLSAALQMAVQQHRIDVADTTSSSTVTSTGAAMAKANNTTTTTTIAAGHAATMPFIAATAKVGRTSALDALLAARSAPHHWQLVDAAKTLAVGEKLSTTPPLLQRWYAIGGSAAGTRLDSGATMQPWLELKIPSTPPADASRIAHQRAQHYWPFAETRGHDHLTVRCDATATLPAPAKRRSVQFAVADVVAGMDAAALVHRAEHRRSILKKQ